MEVKTGFVIKVIAVTGPESTGKSMLTEQLAAHYQTAWVPEYAREYLEHLGRPYEERDILAIAQGQMSRQSKQLVAAKQFLFCDTELLVTKIWSEVKYDRCDPWILNSLNAHPCDLYLLCDVDLPWEYDPLREHPHQRQYLFELYFNELKFRNFPFFVVRGYGNDRLKNAVNFVDDFISGIDND
jgi:NadR type nicotinamide-nucleotide adenylyltransferase